MKKIRVFWGLAESKDIPADVPSKVLVGLYKKDATDTPYQAHVIPVDQGTAMPNEAFFDNVEPGDYIAQVVTIDKNNESVGATPGFPFTVPGDGATEPAAASTAPSMAMLPTGVQVQIVS